jgi:D-serine deaminase-like pyridoxal phosphate-dependent protein
MDWKPIEDLDKVASPGLLVDADRVVRNIDTMIGIVGRADVGRLRPHVKTHKMPAVVKLQLHAGIKKFKVATLTEAEMVASAGGRDVLIAYQMVGPNIARLGTLIESFPQTSFATIVDDATIVNRLARQLGNRDRPLRIFVDVDGGMHRTGIPLGPQIDALRARIESLPGLRYAGLHIYDGHAHSPILAERQAAANHLIQQVLSYDLNRPSPTIVGGGSPTYAIWAAATNWECSPGTPIFWDRGYKQKYAETPFQIAVAVLTRVISKPQTRRLCFDLGYKAVASEVPLVERLSIPAIDDLTLLAHSEEHLVAETKQADQIAVGDAFLAFPRHVCPTIAMYDRATVVRNGKVADEFWEITARGRHRIR